MYNRQNLYILMSESIDEIDLLFNLFFFHFFFKFWIYQTDSITDKISILWRLTICNVSSLPSFYLKKKKILSIRQYCTQSAHILIFGDIEYLPFYVNSMIFFRKCQQYQIDIFFPFSIWKCQTYVFILIFLYLFRVYQNNKLTDKICIFRCSKISNICFRFLSQFFHFIREKKIRAYWTNSMTDSTTVKFA